MIALQFTPSGGLDIKPSATSSKADFDFLEGNWNIRNKKLKSRLTNCNDWLEFDATHEMRKVLAGIGNVENFCAIINGAYYEGMGVRLFNPSTRLWSIYWSDSNSGIMETPVVGSFDKNVGSFFCKDIFMGREILMQFQFDAANPDKPIWSQAFSPDNGKTWERNWYMYFSKAGAEEPAPTKDSGTVTSPGIDINVIELRNYILRPGTRDAFINYFKQHFIGTQNEMGGYTPAQFKVKNAEDNFFWIRGFNDMQSRSKFLPVFYHGPVWKQYGAGANSMLLNNDNVYLLKRLTYNNGNPEHGKPVNISRLKAGGNIAVVDFYIANSKLDQLISFFSGKYLPVLKNAGIENYSLWISELTENDFPRLPVFQDKNLLVVITFYKDELEFKSKQKIASTSLTEDQKKELQDIVTMKNSLVLYPV